jgi:hypothetical protein
MMAGERYIRPHGSLAILNPQPLARIPVYLPRPPDRLYPRLRRT